MAPEASARVIQLHGPQKQKKERPKQQHGWQQWHGVSGGRVWVAEDGSRTYYIRKSVKGRVYQAKLVGDDLVALADQLRRFYADPAGFDPRGVRMDGAIILDDAIIDAYLAWCAVPAPGRRRPRNDKPWLKKKRALLKWWAARLGDRDLRKAQRDELKAALREAGNYKQAVSVIKHLYSFLREEKGLKVEEDPTYASLKTPQSEPAQYQVSKSSFTPEHFETLVAWLEAQVVRQPRTGAGGRALFTLKEAADYVGLRISTLRAYHARRQIEALTGGKGVPLTFSREALEALLARSTSDVAHRVALAHVVLAGTAWHATELVRFSQHGRIDDLPASHRRQNGAVAVLVCEHKGRFLHPTAVTERVAAAARELVAAGGVSLDALYHWTKKAVDATGAPRFAPGQYRHAVTTFAGNQGTPDEDISKFAGHKTATTTKRFYVTRQVPPKIPTFA